MAALNVAIVGCGLIGKKRAQALGSHRLVAVADPDTDRAQQLAAAHPGAVVEASHHDVVARPDLDLVIVATTHAQLAPVAMAALQAGKHVLVEKPGARNAKEFAPVVELSRKKGRILKVGFNHRFHPAMQRARRYIDEGAVGELMFIRGRYGHGGRVGYDKEWRAVPSISGGGELLDQGMHLIDLSRWYMGGEFAHVDGFQHTYFWDMPVDDNAFMLLRTAKQQTAFLHVSWTEWKNTFCLEIYGRLGKLQIDGLGGSYGTERLSYYKMSPEMGPPETTIHEYPMGDRSWNLEMDDLTKSIDDGCPPSGNGEDCLAALHVVEALYARRNA